MSVDSKFDAVSELTGALACRGEPLLVKLDESKCIVAAHYAYDSEHDMGIVFRHAEGLINIGISAFAEMGEHGIVSRLLILTHHNSGIQSLTRRIGAESGSNLHADLP